MRRKAHPISCSSLTQWASKIFGEFKLQKSHNQCNPAHQINISWAKMTFRLVFPSYSLPKGKAIKLTSLHPGKVKKIIKEGEKRFPSVGATCLCT